MKNKFLRVSIAFATVAGIGITSMATSSAVVTPYDPTVDLGSMGDGAGSAIGTAVTSAKPYALGLFGLFLGWGIIRKLIKK